jgi:hypothetical protein
LLVIDGTWYYLMIKINNKIIKFYDSFKLAPRKLAEIGELFNLPKLDNETHDLIKDFEIRSNHDYPQL